MKTPIIHNCPSCGGAIEKEANKCSFCESPIDWIMEKKFIDQELLRINKKNFYDILFEDMKHKNDLEMIKQKYYYDRIRTGIIEIMP